MKAICQMDHTNRRGRFISKGTVIDVATGSPLPLRFAWEGSADAPFEGDPLPTPERDRILVLGDAPGLFADIETLDTMLKALGHNIDACDVMAINRTPFRWQRRVDYWASLHGSHFVESHWLDIWARCPWNGGKQPHIITSRRFPDMHSGYSLVHCDAPGGSAYLAIKAAWMMGYKTIFVAGIEMSGDYGRFAQPTCHLIASIRKHGTEVRVASGALLKA